MQSTEEKRERMRIKFLKVIVDTVDEGVSVHQNEFEYKIEQREREREKRSKITMVKLAFILE